MSTFKLSLQIVLLFFILTPCGETEDTCNGVPTTSGAGATKGSVSCPRDASKCEQEETGIELLTLLLVDNPLLVEIGKMKTDYLLI